MRERAQAALTAVALTVGALGALSAPAAAAEPVGGVVIIGIKTDPTKYNHDPIACGDNMHWGNPYCADDIDETSHGGAE
ncbi:hypothetical protein [Herbidospora sp. NBRC 101105]|uniref:hypothetical protein n=1 Tax=Herbidospora sp. NBRC 101105 TaxID=3032195 RepID=UPI0024A3CE97|nr:hypothetical protein [Herbidospora sp. NBRC 101105]GLX93953.1 hypothetical protein Hesp01_19030 [Herbidospora sp. NBRC 101105]